MIIGLVVAYLFIGSNIVYFRSQNDNLMDETDVFFIMILWPVGLLILGLYYLYKVLAFPARLFLYYQDCKKNDKRFWKWKKVGYDKEDNKIVRLK